MEGKLQAVLITGDEGRAQIVGEQERPVAREDDGTVRAILITIMFLAGAD